MLGVTKKSAAAEDVSLTEWPEPEIGAGQVLVAVKAAGICGTDLHIYRNEYASNPPVILGHEVCGVVEKIGISVDPSWRGQDRGETFSQPAASADTAAPAVPIFAPSAARSEVM